MNHAPDTRPSILDPGLRTMVFQHPESTFDLGAVTNHRYERVFTCLMNGNEAHSVAFTLVGTGNNSAIHLETQHLQIKPTWMGAVSTRCCDIRNPGGVPVFFNWHIPQAYERVLKVEPQSGILRGNETKSLFWHFAPKKQGAYSMRIPCTVERAQVRVFFSKPSTLNSAARERGPRYQALEPESC